MSASQRLYNPWVGKRFNSGDRRLIPEGVRLLVLGDSAYDDGTGDPGTPSYPAMPDYPCIIMKDTVMAGRALPFFTGISRMLAGNVWINDPDYREVWHEIAFTEYVQEPLRGDNRKPTRQQYENGKEPFFEVVRELRITHVIAMGRRLWDAMPYDWDGISAMSVDMGQQGLPVAGAGALHGIYQYQSDRLRFLASGVYHTRSGKFQALELHPTVKLFFSIADKVAR